LSRITKACGHKVSKVNIVNDRGIHICKSMLAWQKWGNGQTPSGTGKKGDHLVGDFYVMFEKELKKQVLQLMEQGTDEEKAMREAPLMKEAQEMLRKWEANDREITDIWEMMNQWVNEGFDETYRRMGVDFDKIYYESDTYKLGRDMILQGVEEGVLIKKDDGSVWADLRDCGLDEKLLLRSDGTSVYITQDIGLAEQRYSEYQFDRHIYVVGNEQNYHFQVLQQILKKLDYDWADNLYHLSYGMVELPHGRMKSREGTVVDADDLMDEMILTARDMSEKLGKLEGYDQKEKENIIRIIGLGALKYFILKVDPKKNMVFNPDESVDFNGNTGPFIQYTYARIRSVLRKAEEQKLSEGISTGLVPNDKELELIKLAARFPILVETAFAELNPSLIANYAYELAKEYNQFYHDHSILSAETHEQVRFRLMLSDVTARVIKTAFDLLGIDVPERM
jgi:arginyl-tRNA synthetase